MSSIFLNVTEPQVFCAKCWQFLPWIFSIAFLSCIFKNKNAVIVSRGRGQFLENDTQLRPGLTGQTG